MLSGNGYIYNIPAVVELKFELFAFRFGRENKRVPKISMNSFSDMSP